MPASRPPAPATASSANRSARPRPGSPAASDAAYRPAAPVTASRCTTPTRICCSCCSDQSAAPARAAGTTATTPKAASLPAACSATGRPPAPRQASTACHPSSAAADSHAPRGACTKTGWTGCPSQTPCRQSLSLPGGSNRAIRCPKLTKRSSPAACSRRETWLETARLAIRTFEARDAGPGSRWSLILRSAGSSRRTGPDHGASPAHRRGAHQAMEREPPRLRRRAVMVSCRNGRYGPCLVTVVALRDAAAGM